MQAPSENPGGRDRRRGYVFFITAMSMVAMIPVVGLAVDVTLLYMLKTKLQAAVDAGAMAGGRSLSRGIDIDAQRASAQATAITYFRANFPVGTLMNLSSPTPTVTVTEHTVPLRVRTVQVTAQTTAPLFFLYAFRHDHQQVVSATGTSLRRDVNIVVIIDRSGSMDSNGGCEAIVTSANEFVEKFANGRDNLGLVTFATSAMVDFPAQQTFRPAVQNIIRQLSPPGATSATNRCDGFTSSAHGVSLAYNELVRLNEAGALNLVLFFTDGIPNTVAFGIHPTNGNDYRLPIRSTSPCVDKSPRTGTVRENRVGIFNNAASPGFIDGTVISNRAGCAFGSGGDIATDVWYFPDFDMFGNNLRGFRTPVNTVWANGANRIRANENNTFTSLAYNSLVSAAERIRYDNVLKPAIYVIGLGDQTAYQHNMLRMIANDPHGTYPSGRAYLPAYPAGMYIPAPTAADLSAAFLRVASEILKISA